MRPIQPLPSGDLRLAFGEAVLNAFRFRGHRPRQLHDETRSVTQPAALGAYRSAVRLDERPHDRQAQTEAARRFGSASCPPARTARRRAAGQRGAIPRPVSVTAIAHRWIGVDVHLERDTAALGRELHRVRQQVRHDLLQPRRDRRRRRHLGSATVSCHGDPACRRGRLDRSRPRCSRCQRSRPAPPAPPPARWRTATHRGGRR